jgi:hypothetical protein
MWSRFLEQLVKVGIVCDDRGNDPQVAVRPRVHYMDISELDVPGDTNWSHCFDPHHPQIFGNNGQEFQDGEHGFGVTPNNFCQGTYLASLRGTSSGQETFVLGAIPTMGGKGEG